MTPALASEVLTFWFEELAPVAWFKRDDKVDQSILERFGASYTQVRGNFSIEGSAEHHDVTLATLIMFDQFPRNMFRGSARAFESDADAVALADLALAKQFDQNVPAARRLFFYLPFEHSEKLADQDRSVSLFARLPDAAELQRYAVAHRDIIVRFGRFPHRNVALGRMSTPEEIAFLAEPGSSF